MLLDGKRGGLNRAWLGARADTSMCVVWDWAFPPGTSVAGRKLTNLSSP